MRLDFRCFAFSFLMLFLAMASRSFAASTHETGFLDRTLSLHGTTYKYQVFLPGKLDAQTEVAHHPFSSRLRRTRFGRPAANGRRLAPRDSQRPLPFSRRRRDSAMLDGPLVDATGNGTNGPGCSRRCLQGIQGRSQAHLSHGPLHGWLRHVGSCRALSATNSRQSFRFVAESLFPATCSKHFPDLAKNAYPDDPESLRTRLPRKSAKLPCGFSMVAPMTPFPSKNSRKLNEALKAAGGNVRYTEYPGVGHNSWDKAYAEPGLMPWLLSKSLRTASNSDGRPSSDFRESQNSAACTRHTHKSRVTYFL